MRENGSLRSTAKDLPTIQEQLLATACYQKGFGLVFRHSV
jgi:hypothetical protein